MRETPLLLTSVKKVVKAICLALTRARWHHFPNTISPQQSLAQVHPAHSSNTAFPQINAVYFVNFASLLSAEWTRLRALRRWRLRPSNSRSDNIVIYPHVDAYHAPKQHRICHSTTSPTHPLRPIFISRLPSPPHSSRSFPSNTSNNTTSSPNTFPPQHSVRYTDPYEVPDSDRTSNRFLDTSSWSRGTVEEGSTCLPRVRERL
jgi:hypothetical protein